MRYAEHHAHNLVVAASIEELSYQLNADALAEQERALGGLRARAGTLVAAANRDRIENLSNWFTISCALLAVEVILWTVSVAG